MNGKKSYSFELSRKLLDKLSYIAEYEGRTKNKELEYIILKHLEEYESKQKNNESKDLPRFTLRTTQEILNQLSSAAESNGRTKNKEIEQIIIKRIAEFEAEHESIDI